MSERIVTADKIVTVATTIEDREVSYDDVFDSVSVEADDWGGEAPWDDCDGWEHETRQLDYRDHDDLKDSRGYARTRWNDPNVLIEIDDDVIINQWGCDAYPGASKQVRAELIAQVKRNALDQLVKWYEDGWEYYYVGGDYKGYSAGVGRVDDYDYAEEMRHEIASEIVGQLENDDYIVTGQPERPDWNNAQSRRDNHKRRLAAYVVHAR